MIYLAAISHDKAYTYVKMHGVRDIGPVKVIADVSGLIGLHDVTIIGINYSMEVPENYFRDFISACLIRNIFYMEAEV